MPPTSPVRQSGAHGRATLIVTGNPNVGKSVLFHWLTGRYATVSNYPGTTVAITHGHLRIGGETRDVHDTPGINSLLASSEDELVTRRLLLTGPSSIVLQVADAKNLERALALTLELAEAELPVILDVNMLDEARERRITIDVPRLAEQLGSPVIPTIATQRWGLERLPDAFAHAAVPKVHVAYPEWIERAAKTLEHALPMDVRGRRAWALLWLAGESDARERFKRSVDEGTFRTLAVVVEDIRRRASRTAGVVISESRLRAARALAAGVMAREPQPSRPWLQRIGALALHPAWGSAMALAVVGVMYLLVGVFAAQTCVGFLEEVVFGRLVNPAVMAVVRWAVPVAWARDLLVGEYGLVTMALTYAVAIILPIVGVFFLCFGFLEDVGYLPRLAVLADRACRLVGLNGKAVLPLVLGLGCDTMATMTARTLESKRDQYITTLLLALAIPCSAQLGVILAMLAGLPPAATWLWLAIVGLSFVAAGQGASRLLGGTPSPFLYEIPPLRWPKFSNIAIKTLGRVEWYMREAVPLFFFGTLVLFALDRTGLLAVAERAASPLVVRWLGLPAQATGAFLIGFLRRDFGAAGFFAMRQGGLLDPSQTLVSLVTITLFVPCFAQYLMMVKERGWTAATAMSLFVVGYAVLAGGLLQWLLHGWPILP